MAIYYIDPHTTTNGTGTWASPWSLNTSTRTGLTNGDEIRIKGVALTSLLTATSYTATVTNNYQLTITAGGGLGADWVLGDIGYLPDYDTFFRVYSVTGNIAQVYTTTSMLPVLDWSATSVTLRKVNTTTYGPSATSSTAYVTANASAYDNITVSDCWTSETTRVTDGSVKSLIQSSGTAGLTLYFNSIITAICSSWTVNCQNTHTVCNRSTSNGYIDLVLNLTDSTVEINQIYSWGTSGTGILLATSGSLKSPNNNTLTIKSYTSNVGVGASPYRGGSGNVFNFTNFQVVGAASFFSASASYSGGENTINFTNVFLGTSGPSSSAIYLPPVNCKVNVSFNGVIDSYSTVAISRVVPSSSSPATITLGSGLSIYYNKRVSQTTTFDNGSYNISPLTQTTSVPTIVNNSSIPITTLGTFNTGTIFSNAFSSILPQQYTWEFPYQDSSFTPQGYSTSVNQTFTYRDGSNPQELLGIYPSTNGGVTYASSPVVTTDNSVYRTSSPSLKSYLSTRTTSIWYNASRGVKTIKIPCTSGTSYTITGYIRCDDTAYVNGDCSVHVYLRDTEVDSQDMTTACINAWEQFTLTFTATETAEYEFAWKMYYANGAKSYWLDDLTIA